MSLNVNIRVPVTALDNEALQQTRRKVNKPPEAEEEDISCFLELLIAKKARDEEFDPAFLAGWLGAYNHWVSSSSIEPTPPVFYRYPIHREIGRDFRGGRDRFSDSQQLQENRITRDDANLSQIYPRGLGLDNLNTRELWGGYEDGMEEAGAVGSTYQPGDLSGSSDSSKSSSEMSEVEPSAKDHVWMRGGGGKRHTKRNIPSSPSPSRSPPKVYTRCVFLDERDMVENPRNRDDAATDSSSRIPRLNVDLNNAQLPDDNSAHTNTTSRRYGTPEDFRQRLQESADRRAQEEQRERERAEREHAKRMEEMNEKLAKMQAAGEQLAKETLAKLEREAAARREARIAKMRAELQTIESQRAALRASLHDKNGEVGKSDRSSRAL